MENEDIKPDPTELLAKIKLEKSDSLETVFFENDEDQNLNSIKIKQEKIDYEEVPNTNAFEEISNSKTFEQEINVNNIKKEKSNDAFEQEPYDKTSEQGIQNNTLHQQINKSPGVNEKTKKVRTRVLSEGEASSDLESVSSVESKYSADNTELSSLEDFNVVVHIENELAYSKANGKDNEDDWDRLSSSPFDHVNNLETGVCSPPKQYQSERKPSERRKKEKKSSNRSEDRRKKREKRENNSNEREDCDRSRHKRSKSNERKRSGDRSYERRIREKPFEKRTRSKSPVNRNRSLSPVYGSRSRSPVIRHKSKSPIYRIRSRSPQSRNRSKSPVYGIRSRSPVYRFRSKSSPYKQRSRSPVYRARSKSPIRSRSRSPFYRPKSRTRNRSRSPFHRARSKSPIRSRSRSPFYRARSPLRNRSRSPFHGARSKSPIRNRSRSPAYRKTRKYRRDAKDSDNFNNDHSENSNRKYYVSENKNSVDNPIVKREHFSSDEDLTRRSQSRKRRRSRSRSFSDSERRSSCKRKHGTENYHTSEWQSGSRYNKNIKKDRSPFLVDLDDFSEVEVVKTKIKSESEVAQSSPESISGTSLRSSPYPSCKDSPLSDSAFELSDLPKPPPLPLDPPVPPSPPPAPPPVPPKPPSPPPAPFDPPPPTVEASESPAPPPLPNSNAAGTQAVSTSLSSFSFVLYPYNTLPPLNHSFPSVSLDNLPLVQGTTGLPVHVTVTGECIPYDMDGRRIPIGPNGFYLPVDSSGRLFPHILSAANNPIPVYLSSDGVLRLPNLEPVPYGSNLPINIDGSLIHIGPDSKPLFPCNNLPKHPSENSNLVVCNVSQRQCLPPEPASNLENIDVSYLIKDSETDINRIELLKKYKRKAREKKKDYIQCKEIEKNLGVSSSKGGVKRSLPVKIGTKKTAKEDTRNEVCDMDLESSDSDSGVAAKSSEKSTEEQPSRVSAETLSEDPIVKKIQQAIKSLFDRDFKPPPSGRFILPRKTVNITEETILNESPLLRNALRFFSVTPCPLPISANNKSSNDIVFCFKAPKDGSYTKPKSAFEFNRLKKILPTTKPQSIFTFDFSMQCDLTADDFKKFKDEIAALKKEVETLKDCNVQLTDVFKKSQITNEQLTLELNKLKDDTADKDKEIKFLKLAIAEKERREMDKRYHSNI